MNTQIQNPAMSQTEIFQNMTKGELTLFKSNGIRYIKDKNDRYIIQVFGLENGRNNVKMNEESDANLEMMLSLWNNVAAKGINPKSVEKMKDVCERLLTWLQGTIVQTGGGATDRKLLKDLKEVLLTAKL